MILSIDTHHNQCLVALSKNGNLISAYSTFLPNQHDKLLAEFTRRILQDNNVAITKIDAISVVAGPGSFTGLRIGFAFVKGLTIGSKVKLIKIPTTEIYAFQAKEIAYQLKRDKIVSIIPGSSGKFFVQTFDTKLFPVTDLLSINAEEILFDDNCMYVGNFDFDTYDYHKRIHLNFINPNDLVNLSFKKLEEEQFSSEDQFEPDYYFEFTPRTK